MSLAFSFYLGLSLTSACQSYLRFSCLPSRPAWMSKLRVGGDLGDRLEAWGLTIFTQTWMVTRSAPNTDRSHQLQFANDLIRLRWQAPFYEWTRCLVPARAECWACAARAFQQLRGVVMEPMFRRDSNTCVVMEPMFQGGSSTCVVMEPMFQECSSTRVVMEPMFRRCSSTYLRCVLGPLRRKRAITGKGVGTSLKRRFHHHTRAGTSLKHRFHHHICAGTSLKHGFHHRRRAGTHVARGLMGNYSLSSASLVALLMRHNAVHAVQPESGTCYMLAARHSQARNTVRFP